MRGAPNHQPRVRLAVLRSKLVLPRQRLPSHAPRQPRRSQVVEHLPELLGGGGGGGGRGGGGGGGFAFGGFGGSAFGGGGPCSWLDATETRWSRLMVIAIVVCMTRSLRGHRRSELAGRQDHLVFGGPGTERGKGAGEIQDVMGKHLVLPQTEPGMVWCRRSW